MSHPAAARLWASGCRAPARGSWLRGWSSGSPTAPQPSHRGKEEGKPGVEGKANLWMFLSFVFFFLILFIYFWLCWVFVSV